jgi:hypothetical protein
VIAAAGDLRRMAAVVEHRPQPDPDARRLAERFDDAHQGGRPEDPAELVEAGREIADLDAVAAGVGQARDQHGSIGEVGLLDLGQIVELDAVEAPLALVVE